MLCNKLSTSHFAKGNVILFESDLSFVVDNSFFKTTYADYRWERLIQTVIIGLKATKTCISSPEMQNCVNFTLFFLDCLAPYSLRNNYIFQKGSISIIHYLSMKRVKFELEFRKNVFIFPENFWFCISADDI